MTGRISGFQSLGAVDGPGLRCVVFFQGCNLRCKYCHNPETWAADGGYEISAEALVEKIDRLVPYIKNGGVTASGGEPLLQWRFVTEFFRRLKEKGIHTAVDTSGVCDARHVEEVLRYTDLVICDIKATDPEKFRALTGGELSCVYDFLSATEKLGISLWIRQVIVPGLNDDNASVISLGQEARRYGNLEKIELLPFRKLCAEKYENEGIDFPMKDIPECDKEKLSDLQKLL